MQPTVRLAVTIPSRLAQVSRVSHSREDARARALQLYRDFYRSAPEICALYALDVPPSTLRAKYREKFEQQKNIQDLAVIDIMLHKGRVEYQETINAWKQIPHLMKLFADEEVCFALEGMRKTCLLTLPCSLSTSSNRSFNDRLQVSHARTTLTSPHCAHSVYSRVTAAPVTFLDRFYSGKDEGRGTTGKASQ
jgi:NADH dehydrogenase (ubiquinone) 1 alpha subcomplex subunit 6